MAENDKKLLTEIFGSSTGLFHPSSGMAMITPGKPQRDRAGQVMELAPLDNVIRDAAISAARELATSLFQANLRPADYAFTPDLAKQIAKRLAKKLEADSDVFAKTFVEYLRKHG